MSQVQVIEYVEYAIQIPGIGSIFLKAPRGSPAPRVVVSETVAAESPVVPISELCILCPFPVPRQAEHTVNVDGNDRAVPAAVARILGRIAKGEREIRLRSEAIDKLRLHLPELLARLHRNHDKKVSAQGAAYTVGTIVVLAK